MKTKVQSGPVVFILCCALVAATFLRAQDPVFRAPVDIDQQKLLNGCSIATDQGCFYALKDVLDSGGDFWTTPFLPFDRTTGKGDGYGEGDNGPRHLQRQAFNPNPHNAGYRFLRMDGLDSQSCFECHNSIGSDVIDSRGALTRKPYTVGGSAGSNSNAFINPYFPNPETLFIRNPPAVFGSGYQQAVAEEMTLQLFLLREQARQKAYRNPRTQYPQQMIVNGIDIGVFKTTYTPQTDATVIADSRICSAGAPPKATPAQKRLAALSIGGVDGYADDLMGLKGVSCDLVIRPFQWKGITSDLRHFIRGALDFHFSMQAFELVGECDCDGDGKGAEVSIGQVTAMASFVAMMRPPVQEQLTTASEKLGKQIFEGTAPGLPGKMCEACHVASLKLVVPTALIEWPIRGTGQSAVYIDPDNKETWPINPDSCPQGTPGPNAMCPTETLKSPAKGEQASTVFPMNRGGLVHPLASSQDLAIMQRYKRASAELEKESTFQAQLFGAPEQLSALIRKLRAPLGPQQRPISTNAEPLTSTAYVVGQDYVIPLQLDPGTATTVLTPLQLPRLVTTTYSDGSIDVPLLSDLKRHKMAKSLSDPDPPLISQGTDIANIDTDPAEYLTRPLWGVADTGPWLHDGRAMTLQEAILMHGDSKACADCDAGPVIDAFEKLSGVKQQAVVDFLLTLRLPLPQGVGSITHAATK